MEDNPKFPSGQTRSTGSFVSGLLFIWDFLKVIIIALIIILPVRYFVFQPFLVSGSSMEPNFKDGQYLVIDELSYRFGNPKRGDVLVLKYPKDTSQYFIKRIIGLPGEKVQVTTSGHVVIYNTSHPDGFTLNEPYLDSQTISFPHDSTIVGGNNIVTLGPDQYFMMGDNRLASSDSRDWGILPKNDIVGKVLVRALPLSEFKLFSTPSYPNL
ncbi:MAG TPA: signal peptidase I [Patescibacteria group bacterium]|nr:signal peptidase I [Patescibacteria group bacterium]